MKRTFLFLALLGASGLAAAQAYPSRPVTIIVPFAAGGPTDKVARDLAEALRKQLNNATIIIDNTGGAGGTLGATKVARAANDGYTLLPAVCPGRRLPGGRIRRRPPVPERLPPLRPGGDRAGEPGVRPGGRL